MSINDKFDLGAFEASNFSKQKEIASRIDEQLQSLGFLIVSNHGIESEKINNIWSVLIKFFNSNQDYKNKVKAPFKGYPYGYLVSESETLAKSKGEFTPPDLKESFNGGPLHIPEGISSDALEFCYLPTIWPNIDNFRKSWLPDLEGNYSQQKKNSALSNGVVKKMHDTCCQGTTTE